MASPFLTLPPPPAPYHRRWRPLIDRASLAAVIYVYTLSIYMKIEASRLGSARRNRAEFQANVFEELGRFAAAHERIRSSEERFRPYVFTIFTGGVTATGERNASGGVTTASGGNPTPTVRGILKIASRVEATHTRP